MTETYLTIGIIVFLLLYLNGYFHLNRTSKLIKKYEKLTDDQNDFIKTVRNDYDILSEKYLNLIQEKRQKSVHLDMENTDLENAFNNLQAKFGIPTTKLNEVFTHVKNQGNLHIDDLYELLKYGYPIIFDIQKYFSLKTTEDAKEKVKSGLVTFKDLEEIIKNPQ